jgi:hypothetical protein
LKWQIEVHYRWLTYVHKYDDGSVGALLGAWGTNIHFTNEETKILLVDLDGTNNTANCTTNYSTTVTPPVGTQPRQRSGTTNEGRFDATTDHRRITNNDNIHNNIMTTAISVKARINGTIIVEQEMDAVVVGYSGADSYGGCCGTGCAELSNVGYSINNSMNRPTNKICSIRVTR